MRIYQKHVPLLKQLVLFPLSHNGSNLTTRKIPVYISTYITTHTENSNAKCLWHTEFTQDITCIYTERLLGPVHNTET